MGKGTKKRFKKLQSAYDDYKRALMYYNAELEQLKSDRSEIEFAKRSGDVEGAMSLLRIYKSRIENVLGAERKRKDKTVADLQDAYKELIDYWDKKKESERKKEKYDDLKKLIQDLKDLSLVG